MKYLLADYLRDQARQHTARADTDDYRNTRAAAALEAVALFVELLPEDDLRLSRIDAAYYVTELDEFYPGPRGKRLIGLWGFHRSELASSPDTFLETFVQCSEDDAVELFQNFGEQDVD